MKLSKQRRGLAVVTLLAVGALVIDRFVLGTGLSEPADAGASIAPTGSGPEAVPEAPAAISAPMDSLAAKLNAARSGLDIASDPFAVPQSWLPAEAQAEALSDPAVNLYRELLQAHRITSFNIPQGGGTAFVFIDGKALKLGDTIEVAGVTLKITNMENDGPTAIVTLESDDQSIEWRSADQPPRE